MAAVTHANGLRLEQNPAEEPDQYLDFKLDHTQDNYGLMLPTLDLVEVLTLPYAQITPIPDTPNFVMGVCNWRGEVVWLIDLAAKLGFEPLYRQGYGQMSCPVILLQVDDLVVGLTVKKIGQMIRVAREQILPTPPTLASSELSKFLSGYWLSGAGQTYLVLNGRLLGAAIA
ncbi:MAG: chemotaxis protein CheW [Pseudanabaenaceae cyanobacterium bins.68]|nr:chemotaxis protein CheW [Pseudanabaenaceae cyanobacterium bins.68]